MKNKPGFILWRINEKKKVLENQLDITFSETLGSEFYLYAYIILL